MQAVKTIGLDIAKSGFQVHGVDADGQVVFRRQLKRRNVLAFFQKVPSCLVIIIRLDRRDLVWINVTTNPTAEWIARQLTEAFPWNETPRYLLRDRDRIYGTIVTRRIASHGHSGQTHRTGVTLAE